MKKSLLYISMICVLTGSCHSFRLGAQNHLPSPQHRTVQSDVEPRYTLQTLQNSWLESENPASIGIMTMPNMGTTQFAGDLISGNLHRMMESGGMKSWGFGSNSYRSLEHLNLWGDFSFMNRFHSDRQWSDNLNPYNGNPYQVGSEIKGDYVEQTFDFDVSLASHRLANRWYFGLGMDYAIGDFSRLNDPRSRVQFADMALTPGLAVQLADHHWLGLDLSYRYRKEKNNKYVTKSASGSEFLLHRQEGFGLFSKVLSSQFERRVKGQWLGGELQYEYKRPGFSLMGITHYQRHIDHLEDLMKECPGNYAEHLMGVDLLARWRGRKSFQTLSFRLDGTAGLSKKNFQELRTEVDEDGISRSEYVTLYTAKAFRHTMASADLSYRHYHLRGSEWSWFLGASLLSWNQMDRYVFYVPSSYMQVNNLSLAFEGGGLVLTKGRHRLLAEATLAYHFNLGHELTLSPDLDKKDLYEQITEPDFQILTTNVAQLGLDLKYFFPVSRTYDGFISLNGNHWMGSEQRHRTATGLSLGIVQRF